MSHILKQRSFFVTKIFEITSNSLKVSTKKPLNYKEEEFSFEEITKKIIRQRYPNIFAVLPGLACFLGVLITIFSHLYEDKGSEISDVLFYAALCVLFLIISIISYKNFILVVTFNKVFDKTSLTFYSNSPDNYTVNTFLDILFADQKKYLLDKYAKADPYVAVEQRSSNIQWLRDRDIINDQELADLQIKILPKPSTDYMAGFRKNPEN